MGGEMSAWAREPHYFVNWHHFLVYLLLQAQPSQRMPLCISSTQTDPALYPWPHTKGNICTNWLADEVWCVCVSIS